MTSVAKLDRLGEIELILRTAACLGALGYSPHEVQCRTAAELDTDAHFIAEIMRSGASGSVCAVA